MVYYIQDEKPRKTYRTLKDVRKAAYRLSMSNKRLYNVFKDDTKIGVVNGKTWYTKAKIEVVETYELHSDGSILRLNRGGIDF